MFRHVSKIALKYTTSIFSQPQEQRQQQNISDVNSIELVELRKGLVSFFYTNHPPLLHFFCLVKS